MIRLRSLRSGDLPAVCGIVACVNEMLENPDWFMPMPEEAVEAMFCENTMLTAFGAFDDNVLVAMALIDTDPGEMADLLDVMELTGETCGELGACVVLPKYRGRQLMYLVCMLLVEKAKEMGLTCLVASAHPENLAIGYSLLKLGMEHKAVLTRGKHTAYC